MAEAPPRDLSRHHGPRRSASILAAAGALLASFVSLRASAHEGSHERMPHQITAGLIPLYVTFYDGGHPGLVGGPIDELSVLSLGVTVSYGFTLWQLLELRVRSDYLKPFPGRAALRDGLHEFRGVVGVSGVVPLVGEDLQLALGPEAGLAAWRLTAIEDRAVAFDSSHAIGYSLGFSASLRGWVTHHTGFWLELGFGLSNASGAGDDGAGIASHYPLRCALGWADRF